MRAVIFAALVVLPGAATAEEPLSIGALAARCWNIPSSAVDADPEVTFDVEFGEGGTVKDITVIDTSLDRVLVLSASLAIERCAPYAGTKPGVMRVTVKSETVKPIDPFKKAN